MTNVKTLNELFVHKLRRVYDAEQRLIKALPKLVEAASSPELKAALQLHFEETEVHVERLDRVFGWFDEKPKADTCDGMKGIIKDGDHAMDLDAEPEVRDAGLIASAQDAEHWEIAAYGTLRTWAVVLEKKDAMQALEVTLEEEKAADQKLTQIASRLNLRAASPAHH